MKQKTEGSLALRQNQYGVIEIAATQQQDAAKLRVAAYARVSSDSMDQLNSFMAQTNYYTTLITGTDNWTMVDLYADEGITGTSAEARPDFQRLLSDCRKGRIDKVLVKSISRFARNAKECLEIIRELKSIGVSVNFEEQGIDTGKMSGELLTAIFASLAQTESESISGNMRWSYKRRMESGTYVPTTLPDGYIRKDGKFAIDEERVAIIRRIFTEYLAGVSSTDIAARLTADGIPSRFGCDGWTPSAIRYILTNEKYTGNSLWQKYYTTDTLPYRHLRNKGERESYYAENTHQAIIPMDEFEAAQKLMEQRRQKITPMKMIPYPLRQKLYCGKCGTVFRRKIIGGITYWACMKHDVDGAACDITQIPESEIYSAFLRLYHKLKNSGSQILMQMVSDFRAVKERQMLWSIDIIELNKRISDISDQNRMLADMNKLGLVDSDIFISQSNELAAKLRAAKQEKERLLGASRDETIPKTLEMLEILDNMPDFLPDFDGEIFGDLIDKVIAASNEKICFHLKNGLQISERIERTVR